MQRTFIKCFYIHIWMYCHKKKLTRVPFFNLTTHQNVHIEAIYENSLHLMILYIIHMLKRILKTIRCYFVN